MAQVTEKNDFSFDEWVEGLTQAFAHIDGEESYLDTLKGDKTHKKASSRRNTDKQLADRLAMLGIPDEQMTAEVRLAVTALLEKLDDVNLDLSRTKEHLAEMERLVDVDPVVPIPNRRAFMRRLSWAINMQERYKHPSTILYFDINDFKQINDQHGHAAGDAAIRHISQLLTNTMRESDFLARIGGDEFAVIMYYAEEDSARQRGAKIAEKLKKMPLKFNGKEIPLSSAYGFYCIQSGDDAEGALSSADTSMYVDKRRTKAARTTA
ncbi:MAG: GGDEF domain-containing protein [Rickettsiales bacterium]